MNKEYNLYELMDSYTDDEFNNVSCEKVNSNGIYKKTMEKIGVKGKKPLRLRTKIVIIAAAVAVLGVITAGSLPQIISHNLTGGKTVEDAHGFTLTTDEQIFPYSVENGRVFFTLLGEHTDITELIDEDTPYIFKCTNPESKRLTYIVVGGTAESLGYAEIYPYTDISDGVGGTEYVTSYNTAKNIDENTGKELSASEVMDRIPTGTGVTGDYGIITVNRGWYQAALDEIGFGKDDTEQFGIGVEFEN